ncbi:SDR family oxidoreductase [Marinoscillum pacificum]|uniref:SDR family oxidoreductase n=1 Tax=Marinoscillum pacificum TaxID=392723 RepID=UPI002157932B|nr:SDR family oxidoreductase [Marinoscillum pacificum]
MKILVTGANGLLGQKLVAILRDEKGIELIATARGVNRNPEGGYTYLSADLRNMDGIKVFIEICDPDVIIHCAAMTQVDECEQNQELCWENNVDTTQNLIEIAKSCNAHFVYVSTDFVFDGKEGPYTERDMPKPISVYGESKLAAEKLLHQSGISYAIVRTVLVYGTSLNASRSNLVLWVKKSLEAGEPIKVVNDQWRTPTLAEDLAKGCYLVAKGKHEGIFHISGEGMMTPYEMALKVAESYGLNASLITEVDASTFSQPGKRPPKTGFVIEKAKEKLGFQPTSFEEGLKIVAQQLQ